MAPPSRATKAPTACSASRRAVKTNFDQKMAQAPSTEKGRLADEAADAMTKAVTDQGLSVDEYVAIIEVAQSDPVVRDKLIRRMR